jgi:hypothetical protein
MIKFTTKLLEKSSLAATEIWVVAKSRGCRTAGQLRAASESGLAHASVFYIEEPAELTKRLLALQIKYV